MSSAPSTAVSAQPRIGERVRYWLPAVVVLGLCGRDMAVASPRRAERRELSPATVLGRHDRALGRARGAGRGAWITFKEALGGFVIGSSAAFVSALVLARWRPFGDALMPYMIAANAIPIIAFAPITNAWFGTLSPWSKIAMAAVLCYFPVLVNTLRGLTSVNPESIELMRSYAAPSGPSFGAYESRTRFPSCSPP